LIASAAHGQQPAPRVPAAPHGLVIHGEEALAVALRVMMAQGQHAQALQLIDNLPSERRDRTDLLMVRAQLLSATGDTLQAVDIYRRLLARFPADQRIRLELAETLFVLKDLRAAEHYFRLALSGDLPDQDRQLARAYLSRILATRPWTVSGGLGVAPDTNVNAATQSRTVEIWGLPFELTDEARQRSGVGVSAWLQGEGSLRLGDRARLTGTLWSSVNEYRDRAFSSEGVGLRLGTEFSTRETRWSINAIGERRWYGGEALYRSLGASLNGDVAAGQGRTVYGGALSAQRIDFDVLHLRDGWLYGADLQRTRYLSPRMFWRASISARANRARADAESYDSGRIALGVYRTLPLRLGLYAEPSWGVTRYRGPAAFFGVAREDREAALSVRLVKEDYSVWGFSPYVSGQLSRVDSTIPIYGHDRGRLEFGVTRTF
jgi:outer membrane protein